MLWSYIIFFFLSVTRAGNELNYSPTWPCIQILIVGRLPKTIMQVYRLICECSTLETDLPLQQFNESKQWIIRRHNKMQIAFYKK